MALCSIEYVAPSLRKFASMHVFLPEQGIGRPPYPVLYLLHGLSQHNGVWLRNTNLYRYVEGLPLIVVMPDGQRSFYCNDLRPDGLAWEDHIINDVIGFAERNFPILHGRAARAIGGMSWPLRGGLPAGAGHLFSPTTCPAPTGVQGLAAALPREDCDCFDLALRRRVLARKLKIRIGCGRQNGLLAVMSATLMSITKSPYVLENQRPA